jgi:hypothetical protein
VFADMKFSFDYKVDSANKLLICELTGEAKNVTDLEHLLKTIVKMAGKNQVKNVVVDGTQFQILCDKVDIAKSMITMQEQDWLGDIKIARIVDVESNMQNIIEGIAANLSLNIKNFETRSDAMLWLLFDKVRNG